MKTQIKLYALGIGAYVFATMTVQMLNHFVINRAHYEAVPFLRTNPVFALGILSMLVQGTVLVFLFKRIRRTGSWYSDAIKYALMMGLFFSSYSILAEPAKYSVPSALSWATVEAVGSFAQFLLFGLLLAVIFKRTRRSPLSKRTRTDCQ